MTLSLRQRILWWSVASSLVILLVTFLFVDEAFRTTILRDQEENLVARSRLVAELQQSEIGAAMDRTASIAAAPTLRAALETRDSATIRQNLDLLLESSGMGWLAVTTPEGEMLASTPGAPLERVREAASVVREARFYDTGDLWFHEGRLVQVHVSGIFFGSTPLGVLLGGAEIGTARVSRLVAATQQGIAFLAGGRLVAGGEQLTQRQRADLAPAWSFSSAGAGARSSARAAGVREFSLGGDPFLGATIPLPDGSGAVVGELISFRSLEEAMRPARDLRLALLAIAVVGILVAFGSSYLLARRVIKPVNNLLLETVRLGSGDLEQPIRPERADEIGKLAEGFETMRVSLHDAQQELLRAERLSAVGRAASAIVHDFRQPVMVIQGYVSLLKADVDDRAQQEQDLTLIETELARLNSMMGEILDFARGGDRVQMESGIVSDLLGQISRAVGPSLEGQGIALEVDHGYDGEWELDFPRTRRVLENLVRNAASAMRSGGTVCVRSALTDRGLRLTVEDTGPGIPEEIRDHLFEPFVTHGKAEGTGLGLAIVKAFTERQGGTVRFETSGSGTTFLLDFPEHGTA